MLTLWGMVLAGAVGAVPALSGFWIFDRIRARRRNRAGSCAACGVPWGAADSPEPFLIQGRLVCSACADLARRRLPWYLGFVALATTGAGVASGLVQGWTLLLVPILSGAAMTVAAVELMKAANRRAERRIASGDFPALHAVAPGGEPMSESLPAPSGRS